MKPIFNRITICLFILLLTRPSLSGLSSKEVEEQLQISQAYVALEKKHHIEAGKITKQLIRKKVFRADVFFILGEIHYRSELWETALSYYQRANKLADSFIMPHDRFQLLWKMTQTCQKMNRHTEAIGFLNEILILTEDRTEKFYQTHHGKANFEIALNFQFLQKWELMNDFFLRAIRKEYHPHLSYLFLLHYLARYNQQEIKRHFNHTQPNDRLNPDDPSLEIPNRKNYFLHYFRIWKETKPQLLEKIQFEKDRKIYRYSSYENMVALVKNFHLNLTQMESR